jgi:hexosaminidase
MMFMNKIAFFFILFLGGMLPSIGQNKYLIVPKPTRLDAKEGQFVLPPNVIIAVASTELSLRHLAEELAQQIGLVSGRDTRVFAGNFRVKDGINLVVSKDLKLGENGYFLEVTPKNIVITAEQIQGFRHGLQSLKQLMPNQIFGKTRVVGIKWYVPCCYIEDQPQD